MKNFLKWSGSNNFWVDFLKFLYIIVSSAQLCTVLLKDVLIKLLFSVNTV